MRGNEFSTNEEESEFLVDKVLDNWDSKDMTPSELIPILQNIQAEVGYLSQNSLKKVSKRMKLAPSHVYGVATFYHQFRLRPEGKHIITICQGTACHVMGATDINRYLMHHLKIEPPDDTSPDGIFTVKQVRCIGACSLSPVIKIDDKVYGKLDSNKIQGILVRYRKRVEDANQ